MAYDAGILEEGSADLLRQELKAIEPRGKPPQLADFYDRAQRNLEHFAVTPEVYGDLTQPVMALHETARQTYRAGAGKRN